MTHQDAASASSPRATLSWWRKAVYAVLTIIVFFLLLESLLWAIGAGNVCYDGFVGFQPRPALFEKSGEEYVTAEVWTAFFNQQRFPVRKQAPAVRIFCLGGSTTFGYPFDARCAYPQWLQSYLREMHPDVDWHVVNCGGISHASYRLAQLVDELKRYEPDLLIIHTGHNEFLEERSYSRDWRRNPIVAETIRSASHLRTFRTLNSALDPNSPLAAEVSSILERNGIETYHRDDELRRDIVRHFRASLREIVRGAQGAGIPVILVQPASNLKDFSPFKSESAELPPPELSKWNYFQRTGEERRQAGDKTGAIQLLREAVRIDPRHAQTLYNTGMALFEAGEFDEAHDYLIRARDEDICPLRAPTEIEQAVAEVAASEKVAVVDLPRLLEERCRQLHGHRSLGLETFYDHVNPQIEVHSLIAKELYKQLVTMKLAPSKPISEEIERRVSGSIQGSLNGTDMGMSLYNLALTLNWTDKNEEALRLTEGALTILPENSAIISLNGWLLRKLGREEEAVAQLQEAVRVNPKDSLALSRLASGYMAQGEYKIASSLLRQAVESTPDRASAGFRAGLHVALGRCLREIGDHESARIEFQTALSIDPQCTEARELLRVMK